MEAEEGEDEEEEPKKEKLEESDKALPLIKKPNVDKDSQNFQ